MRPPDETKAALRAATKARVDALSPSARADASRAVCDRVTSLPDWSIARAVLLFLPATDEPDITPLLHAMLAGGRLALPRVLDWAGHSINAAFVTNLDPAPPGDLVTTRHALRQPRSDLPGTPLADLDLCLVPGRAFDRFCNRLGRGGGFYDVLLRGAETADHPPTHRPLLVGVCFNEQVTPLVPTDDHDIRLDLVVTPTTLYDRRTAH